MWPRLGATMCAGGLLAQLALAGACSRAPVVLAEAEKLPRGVAADSDFVYWTSTDNERGEGAVRRVLRRGGPVTTLYRARGVAPTGLALDGAFLVWTEVGASGVDGRVLRARKAGGAATVLARRQRAPRAVAADGGAVFWVNRGAGPSGGAVVALERPGAEPVALAPGRSNPWSLAIDRRRVYWTEADIVPGDDVEITGRVMAVDRRGGTPRVLARTRGWPQEIAVDARDVYWSEQRGAHGTTSGAKAGGVVQAVGKRGGAVRTVAALAELPAAIALAEDRVYWLQHRLHDRRSPGFCYTLASADKTGGSVVEHAFEEKGPGALVADAHGVIWTDLGAQRAWTRPRFEGAIHRLGD